MSREHPRAGRMQPRNDNGTPVPWDSFCKRKMHGHEEHGFHFIRYLVRRGTYACEMCELDQYAGDAASAI